MSTDTADSPATQSSDSCLISIIPPPEIPIEIVSEEEMAFIDAPFAVAATRSSFSSTTISSALSSSSTTQFHRNARSIRSIILLSKRSLSGCNSEKAPIVDIEDLSCSGASTEKKKKKSKMTKSLLHRFLRKKGLFVTDVTSTTLDDLLRCYQNTCSILPKTHDQMLLRYEYQKDHSLISEAQFSYDPSWFKSQLKCCLEFWRDEREASYAPEEERWKCKFCKYASICPTSIKPEEAAQTTQS